MDNSDNLLIALHKWAHRQDENFITEVFAHLLRQLLKHAPHTAAEIVHLLSGGRLRLELAECPSVAVVTQSRSEIGTPDITVRWGSSLLLIESKIDSGFGSTQVGRYRKMLDDLLQGTQYRAGCLTTLTRQKLNEAVILEYDVVSVRWQCVAEHLAGIPAKAVDSAHTRYLIEQFTQFLRQRMIEMQQISPELTEGVGALRRMLKMLEQSLRDHDVKIYKKLSGWYKVGYWLNNKRWRVTVSYKHPSVVVFETCGVPIHEQHLATITAGTFQATTNTDTTLRWLNRLDLNEKDGEFYHLPAAQQKDLFDKFVAESIEVAQLIG